MLFPCFDLFSARLHIRTSRRVYRAAFPNLSTNYSDASPKALIKKRSKGLLRDDRKKSPFHEFFRHKTFLSKG